MAESQARRPSVRWWVIALLLLTLAWAFVRTNEAWVRKRLEEWGVTPPTWSSGEKGPGGEWAPKEFVPERPGPRLREVARWPCSLVKEVAWFPDGKRLAVSAGEWLRGKGIDGQPRSWCVMELPGLRDVGTGGRGGKCLEVSAKGAIALTTYRKDTPPRWSHIDAYAPDTSTPALGFDVSGNEPPMCFTPDGTRLVTVTPEGLVQVWATDTWKEVGSLSLPEGDWDALGLDIDKQGHYAVIAQRQQEIGMPLLIDLTAMRVAQPMEPPRLLLVTGLAAISPDGRYVALQMHSLEESGGPIVYDRETGTALWHRGWPIETHPLLTQDIVRVSRFSPDGRLLATCGYNGHVGLFDARDGALYDQHYVFDPHTSCVRWSPDGTMVAFGGNGGLVVYEVVRPSGWK